MPALPKSKSKVPASAVSTPALSRIPQLEAQLLAPPHNPNNLIPLLQLARSQSPEAAHKASWALHRVFIAFIAEGRVSYGLKGKGRDLDDEVAKVKAWTGERLEEYVQILAGMLRDTEPSLRASATPLLLSLLPPLSKPSSSSSGVLSSAYAQALVNAYLLPIHSPRSDVSDPAGILPADVVALISGKYLAENDDLRWAFFKHAASLIDSRKVDSSEALAANALAILCPLSNLPQSPDDINTFFCPHLTTPPATAIPTSKSKKAKKDAAAAGAAPADWTAYYDSPSEEEDDTPTGKKRKRTRFMSIHEGVHSVESHKQVFTSVWLEVLSLPLSVPQKRQVLMVLHSTIFPNMVKGRAIRIADWLGSIVDGGGPLALLSMNGLFLLIKDYNLDYPNFYTRLYNLLDSNVMHLKYRARFFRLTDLFLSSTHLPAAIVAAFIKRLARLTLTAPPAAIIMIIPFVYNLFKKHPGCMVMIQREAPEAEGFDDVPAFNDPYDAAAVAPLDSHAIDSSVWELTALQRHYLASVSTMAKVFSEVFTKPQFGMEDFLDHGYGTLFDTEAERKIRKDPALANVDDVGVLFLSADEESERRAAGDLVTQLWSF